MELEMSDTITVLWKVGKSNIVFRDINNNLLCTSDFIGVKCCAENVDFEICMYQNKKYKACKRIKFKGSLEYEINRG